jgi:DNA-binding NarL/FixJ family response regulator
MSDASAVRLERNLILKLLLVDDDPIFRVGLRTCLSEFPNLQIVAEADSYTTALQALQAVHESGASERTIDIVLINLALESSISVQGTGLALCQQLKSQSPSLPILLLSTLPEPTLLAAAYQTGVEGYCAKGTAIADLVTTLRRVAAGQPAWEQGMQIIAQSVTRTQPVTLSNRRPPIRPTRAIPAGALNNFRYNLRLSGLEQIDAALAAINAQLDYPDLSSLERLVLTGQRRELKAARWVVNRLLGTTNAPPNQEEPAIAENRPRLDRAPSPAPPPRKVAPEPQNRSQLVRAGSTAELATVEAKGSRAIQAELFDRTFAKLQLSLQNLTDLPLEIDILREDKKRELLDIVLRKFEAVLDELRFSQVQPSQLVEKQAAILQDLWREATIEYFGKYYTLSVGQQELEIVDVFLHDAGIIQTAILNKIPLVSHFLASLLFQAPLIIDNVAYPIRTPEGTERAEILLQNLIIQVSNAVVQPLLNHVADVETVKQAFYDRRLLSTREIERFRNNLSWKYRVEYWLIEPKVIFESQYRLYRLNGRGIKQLSVYAPRTQELADLSGIRYAVTLALETRDAIAPRLRAAIAFVGSGVVYVLTEVLGRGIGLIGRGIIKGVGNALQDNKLGRNSER